MKVAIVGVGAIGGAVAGALVRAGHEVALVARTPFAQLFVDDVEVASATFDARGAAWVLVCTKAYDTPTLDGGARVALLQNGVEHEARVPGCVPVIVQSPASRDAPGRVRTRGPVKLTVRDDDAGRAFAALAPAETATGFIERTHDFTTALWRKLCINVAGIVTVLEDAPLGCIREERVAAHAQVLIEECARVGNAAGARLGEPAEFARALVTELQAGDADRVPSILQDLRARRPLEVDARNGAVVRFGARHGIATPANGAVVAALLRR